MGGSCGPTWATGPQVERKPLGPILEASSSRLSAVIGFRLAVVPTDDSKGCAVVISDVGRRGVDLYLPKFRLVVTMIEVRS